MGPGDGDVDIAAQPAHGVEAMAPGQVQVDLGVGEVELALREPVAPAQLADHVLELLGRLGHRGHLHPGPVDQLQADVVVAVDEDVDDRPGVVQQGLEAAALVQGGVHGRGGGPLLVDAQHRLAPGQAGAGVGLQGLGDQVGGEGLLVGPSQGPPAGGLGVAAGLAQAGDHPGLQARHQATVGHHRVVLLVHTVTPTGRRVAPRESASSATERMRAVRRPARDAP